MVTCNECGKELESWNEKHDIVDCMNYLKAENEMLRELNKLLPGEVTALFRDATKYHALQSENARLRDALEKIAQARGDADKLVCLVTIDLCANVAKEALKDAGDETETT